MLFADIVQFARIAAVEPADYQNRVAFGRQFPRLVLPTDSSIANCFKNFNCFSPLIAKIFNNFSNFSSEKVV